MKRFILIHFVILIVTWGVAYFGFRLQADRHDRPEIVATPESFEPGSPLYRNSHSRLNSFLEAHGNVPLEDRLDAWGLKDPSAVADYLVQQDEREHHLRFQSFLLTWFLRDPTSALEWLDESNLSPGNSLIIRSKLFRDVLSASESPAIWQTIALSFPPGREGESALAMTSVKIFSEKPEMLSSFFQTIKNPRMIDLCYKSLSDHSIAADVDKAVSFAEEIGDSRLRLHFYTSIFPAASQNTLEQALNSLTQVAVRSEQVSAIRSIIKSLNANTYDQADAIIQNSSLMDIPYMRELVGSSLRARMSELADEETKID